MASTRENARKPFRLGDLSEVTSNLVFQRMNVIDLFDISLCSTSAKKLVRNATSKFSKIDFLISNSSVNLTVHLDPNDTKNRYKNALFWMWPTNGRWPTSETAIMERVVEGVKIKCDYEDRSAGILSSSFSVWKEEMEAVFNHFMQIFPQNPIDNVKISVNENYSSSLIEKTLGKVGKCKNLEVSGCKDGEFSKEDYQFFAEKMETFGKLHLCLEPPEDVRISKNKVFKCEKLEICWSFWFCKEHLMSSDCADIKLHKSKLKLRDLYQFVKKWAESDNQRFTTLHCEFVKGKREKELNIEEDFNLKTEKWNEKERSAYYRLKEEYSFDDKQMNCSGGVDIHRKDGKLATVLVKDTHFDFVVWHERFHDTEGLKYAFTSRRYNS